MNKNIIFVIILLFAFFSRFYLLGDVPAGLMNDEADKGYDAYSILLTGRDQWGEFLPLVAFKGFGDYRPPLYTYLVVPLIKIVGLNTLAVRLPSAIAGVIAIWGIFLLTKKMFNEKQAMVTASLLALSPWAIGLNRVGLEANIAIVLLVFAIYFFQLSIRKKYYFIVSILLFILIVYCYTAYIVFIPLLLITLYLSERKRINSKWKVYLLGLFLFLILVSPFILNQSNGSSVRFSQIGLTNNINSIGIINTLNDERGICLKSGFSLVCKIAYNKPFVFLTTFLANYIHHFSPSYLYVNGDNSQYAYLPQRGLELLPEIVLFIAGIVFGIYKRNKSIYILIMLLLFAPIPDSLTSNGDISRGSIMLPFLIMLEGLGLYNILNLVNTRYIYALKLSKFTLVGILFLAECLFLLNYFTYFNNYNSSFSQYGYEQLMHNVLAEQNQYYRIYISHRYNDTKQYIYYLFYSKYSPEQYQKKKNISLVIGSDGWVDVNAIGKIYFVDTISMQELNKLKDKNVLLIGNPKEFCNSVSQSQLSNIKDKVGTILFTQFKLNEYIKQAKIKDC